MPTSRARSRLSSRAPTPADHGLFVAIIILAISAVALIGLIIYITLRLKKRGPGDSGPYEGTVVHPEHPAAQITPFGASGPHMGRNLPQFSHIPGENMRIAFRQPDGAWLFADSLSLFAPAGINDIDVLPSPSASISEFSREGLIEKPSYPARP